MQPQVSSERGEGYLREEEESNEATGEAGLEKNEVM